MFSPERPFWRDEPLTTQEHVLFLALQSAHARSAQRDNLSTRAVMSAALGSGSYVQAMAAPLLTLGELHAPVAQAMALLRDAAPSLRTRKILESGQLVPGWGNSFIKGEHDGVWADVHGLIGPVFGQAMIEVTRTLHGAGKLLYPNPGGYTAACALVLKMPASAATYLFIAGRLEVWSRVFLQHSSAGRVWKS